MQTPAFLESLKDKQVENIDQERIVSDTNYVFEVYAGSIHQLFHQYCHIFSSFKARPCINKAQFLKFCRDFNFKAGMKEVSYELLWIRSTKSVTDGASTIRRTRISLSSEQTKSELTLKDFQQTLLIIAEEVYKNQHHYTNAQKLENLIITYILPKMSAIELAMMQQSPPSKNIEGSLSPRGTQIKILSPQDESQDQDIGKLFKAHSKHLVVIFQQFSMVDNRIGNNSQVKNRGMTLKNLMSLCQHFTLLPLITKKKLSTVSTADTLTDVVADPYRKCCDVEERS